MTCFFLSFLYITTPGLRLGDNPDTVVRETRSTYPKWTSICLQSQYKVQEALPRLGRLHACVGWILERRLPLSDWRKDWVFKIRSGAMGMAVAEWYELGPDGYQSEYHHNTKFAYVSNKMQYIFRSFLQLGLGMGSVVDLTGFWGWRGVETITIKSHLVHYVISVIWVRRTE